MGTELAVTAGSYLAEVERHGFGTTELERRSDMQGSAVAAREQAAIQARYVMALQRPRNIDEVRTALLDECRRPRFAAVARYRKPVGGGKVAEGWSIRFAEAAKRCLRNVADDVMVVADSPAQRIVRFTCCDLESNTVYTSELVIQKTIERKLLKDGQAAISERKNSKGETTYTVYATDDEVAMKQAAGWSKFIRNSIRFVPGDILDECLDQVNETLADDDRKDPAAARKRIIDGFHSIGVEAADLQMLLGHPLTAIQPKEMQDLRGIYASIRDGEATWRDICEARQPAGSAEAAAAAAKDRIAKADAENAARRAAAQNQKSQDPPTTVKGDGKTSDHPADESEAGETPSREAAEQSSEIPPVSSLGIVREFDEFPDPMEYGAGAKIYVSGKLYAASADRNSWIEVAPQAPAPIRADSEPKPKLQFGRKPR